MRRCQVMFRFHNPGELIDDDLELVLVKEYPGDPEIHFVPAYKFEMRIAGSGQAVGKIELRIGNTNHIIMYGGHVAYGVSPEHRGHHYAARGCKLLLPLARGHDLKTLWITCNPDNIASARTCELAGAELIKIVDLPEDTDMFQEGERQKCRYKI